MKNFFDVDFYKAQNPDVVKALGDDEKVLFNHFCLCGVFEGRTCNPSFDPAAYASAYSDLKEKFGSNIVLYYMHYAKFGITEKRTLTTVEACAEAGITVEALADSSVKISPAVYLLSRRLGTTDFATVQKAIESAISSASSSTSDENVVIETAQGSFVIVPSDDTAYAKATSSELTKIGILTLSDWGDYSGGVFNIYFYKGTTGYGATTVNAYNGTVVTENDLIYKTADYTGDPSQNPFDVEGVEVFNFSASSYGSESNLTNEPYYKSDIVTTVENYPTSYNHVQMNTTAGTIGYYPESEITGTDYYKFKEELAGYYTNATGSEYHVFADDAEKEAYCREYSFKNGGNGYVYSPADSVDDIIVYDLKGDANSTYDISLNIEQNEDGTIKSITVAASNDETQFGYVNKTNYNQSMQP